MVYLRLNELYYIFTSLKIIADDALFTNVLCRTTVVTISTWPSPIERRCITTNLL